MKTILVAIDFSKNSEHALDYALIYAKKLNTDIALIWVDNTSSDETVTDAIEGNLRREKKAYMQSVIEHCEKKLDGKKVKAIFRKGKIYQEIAKAARQIEADMIFAGTHGVSGFEQYWIGSNTYRIVTQAPCPVVTIQGEYKFGDSIKDILLPLDSSLETKQKLPFVCRMAQKFGAKVHLLLMYNTPLNVIRKRIDKIGQEAEKCLTENNMDYVLEKIEADNVAMAILDYTSKSC